MPYSQQQLEDALRALDAKGDVDSARVVAGELQKMKQSAVSTPQSLGDAYLSQGKALQGPGADFLGDMGKASTIYAATGFKQLGHRMGTDAEELPNLWPTDEAGFARELDTKYGHGAGSQMLDAAEMLGQLPASMISARVLGKSNTFWGALAKNAAAGAATNAMTYDPGEKSVGEIATAGGIDAGLTAVTAALPAAFNVVKKVAKRKLDGYMSRAAADVSGNEKIFDAQTGADIFLTPTQATGSPKARYLEQQFMGDTAFQTFKEQNKGIFDAYKTLASAQRQGQAIPTRTVQDLRQRLLDISDKHYDLGAKEYESFANMAMELGRESNLRVKVPKLTDNLMVLKAQNADVFNSITTFLGQNDPRLSKKLMAINKDDSIVRGIMAQRGTNYENAMQFAKQTGQIADDVGLTTGELIKLTKGINKLYRAPNVDTQAAAKFMRGALGADVKDAVVGNPDIMKDAAFAAYNNALRRFQGRMGAIDHLNTQVLGEFMGKEFSAKNAPDLLAKLQNASSNDQKFARRLLAKTDPSLLQDLRQLSILRTIEEGQGSLEGLQQAFSSGRGQFTSKKVNPAGLFLFDPQQQKALLGGSEKVAKILRFYPSEFSGRSHVDPQSVARVAGGMASGNAQSATVFLPGILVKAFAGKHAEQVLFTREGQKALEALDPTSTVTSAGARATAVNWLMNLGD